MIMRSYQNIQASRHSQASRQKSSLNKLAQQCLLVITGALLNVMSFAGPAHDKLPMTGIADHWQLRQEVYIGALYLPVAPKTPEEIFTMAGPKRMELRITAEKLSPRQWSEMWNQQININNAGKDELKGMTDDVIGFTGLLKEALTNGDRVTIDYTPKAGVEIGVNGTTLYKSSRDAFFNAVVKAWIGPRPPSSDFKRNIVVLPTDAESKDLIDRYTVVLPEDKRKAEIAAWVKAPEPPKVAEKPKPAPVPVAAKPEPKPEPKPIVAALPVPVPAAPVVKPALPVPTPAPVAAAPVAKPVEVAKVAPPPAAPAPAPVAAAPAPAAATKAGDDAARLDGVRNIYRANMLRLTYRHVIYPATALSKNQEGTVIMKVAVNRAGKVINIGYEKESDFAALNKAAEKAVKKASPFPAVPTQLPGDKFEFSIPIKFRIPT